MHKEAKDNTYAQEKGADESQSGPSNQNNETVTDRKCDLFNHCLSNITGEALEQRAARSGSQHLNVLCRGVWKKRADLLEANILEQSTRDCEKSDCAESLSCSIY
jgi:hypothetical protein